MKEVKATVRPLQAHAHTGEPGDGSIVVARVDGVVRIRTGQRSWGEA
jgi:nitrogen regulatory protein PII